MFIKTCFNLVATYTKSLLSIDNGQSWTKMNINGDEVINIQSNKANIYHAVCHDSSYYSVDYGKTWNPLKYEISSYKNFYFAPDQTLYMVGLGGPYLTRSKVDGSDLEIIEPGICCDGDILQLLFHPTGRIYINWSGNLFYSDARGENAQYDRQNSMRCYPGCILSSKGDLYSLVNGLNFIEPDLSQKTLIEPLDFRARIAGIDNNNQVFVFDPVKGLLLCNRSACKPFDMTGLPFPYMFIRTIYQDENNFLYVGLDNDKIYKYSQPIVSNKDPIENNSETIKVFPNPFSSSLNVEVLKSKTGNYHVVVQDIFGRTIHNSIEKQSNFKIETESILRGIYFMRVNDSGYWKIIKTE